MKFAPVFHERIWGADNLKKIYNKPLPANTKIGESWELSDLPGNRTKVQNGPWQGLDLRELLDNHFQEIGLTQEQAADPFGLFIKFLDADDVLSVQVHPDKEACKLFPNAALKTECWYVLDAKPGAKIYQGLKPNIGPDQLAQALKNGTVDQLLVAHEVKKGDFHHLPAGTIHALGAGVLVAEIQTPSDTTFRVFDWNRTDANGKSRELHVEQALASIHYTNGYGPAEDHNVPVNPKGPLAQLAAALGDAKPLVDCDFFSVALSTMAKGIRKFTIEQTTFMIALDCAGTLGSGKLALDFVPGDTILLPQTEQADINVTQPGQCMITCLGPVKA